MGKTHEALKRSEEAYQAKFHENLHKRQRASVTEPTMANQTRGPNEWYANFKANLFTRYTEGTIKTLMFAGTSQGVGVTATAVNFAATLARDSKRKVLLVDGNLRTPSIHKVFKIEQAPGLADIVTNSYKCGFQANKMRPGNLFVLSCGNTHTGRFTLFESRRFDRFLNVMRKIFDHVIVDAPPFPVFPESLVLCAKMDGVVLVVGAGKTRRQVAHTAKEELESAGGKLLGVVVNKRKYHIPEWIYRRL